MSRDHDDPLGLCGTLLHGKYRVESVVARGGRSIVYRAEQILWKEFVALRCFVTLSAVAESRREQLLADFLQEGKLLTALSSRSAAIVQARDVGTFTTSDGVSVPYMVLEWLDGHALGAVLADERGRGMPARTIYEVMSLLEPVAVALELAHTQGVAHRDIKPANLFVLGEPRAPGSIVKLLDFGVAKVMADQAASGLAQTGNVVTAFTPGYGAPEQFSRSYGATGPWTDVYAMALVMTEMLRGGARVFDTDDYVAIANAAADVQVRPVPHAFGVPVTRAVNDVFARALAVAPAHRFPTMGAFWANLHHALFPDAPGWTAGSTSSGNMAAPSSRGTIPLPTMTPHPSAAPAEVAVTRALPRGPRRGGAIALGIFLVLALGAAATVAVFLRGRAPSSTLASALSELQPAIEAIGARKPGECPDDMVLVPGGKFFMGSDDPGFKLWQPAHKVLLDAFCIGVHEVTVASFRECVEQGGCKPADTTPDYPKVGVSDEEHEKTRRAYSELCNFGKAGRDQHPINCVSWFGADAYCTWQKQRLPTEAEWEYAARGSDGRTFPWGDEPGGPEYMNACGIECNRWEQEHGLAPSQRMYDVDDGFAGTSPVGSFPKGKTRLGAFDVVGNVWEWTADWFETYKPDEAINPKGAPAGDRKAIRGGAFNGGVVLWHNPAFRYHQLATASSHGIGFRCAIDLAPARSTRPVSSPGK